jgi:hypothetical protein
MARGKIERVLEEPVRISGIGLIPVEVAVSKILLQLHHEVFGIEPVALAGDEADGALRGGREVEDLQSPSLVEKGAKLFEAATVASFELRARFQSEAAGGLALSVGGPGRYRG